MLHRFLHWLKSFLTLNKSEQRGILLLIILILGIGLFNLFLPGIFRHKGSIDTDVFRQEIDTFSLAQQKAEDSVRIEKLQNRGQLNEELAMQKIHPFPFNPNGLPVEAWSRLGLTQKQIKLIKKYESKGGKFHKKEDLRNMYCISEAEYNILEPYIKIPAKFKTSPAQIEKNPVAKKIRYLTTEINAADSAIFVRSLSISPRIAIRIVRYRNLLGGFAVAGQLKEVYGMDAREYRKLKPYILVDTSLIKKININKADFKEILKHPYISYDITKKIVNYRAENGPFTSITELTEEHILSPALFIKLKPYLKTHD